MDTPEQQSGSAAQSAPYQPPTRKQLPNVPDELLRRYNARVLDPSTAVRVPGQPPFRSTVYVADRLILNGSADAATREVLQQAAARDGLRVVFDDDDNPPASHNAALEAGLSDRRSLFSTGVRLEPAGDGPAAPPNAWQTLQTFRSIIGRDNSAVSAVALDHLLVATGPDIGGSPFVTGHGIEGSPFVTGHGVGGNPFVTGHGIASNEYGAPGFGGRAPVNWVGPEPHRRTDDEVTCRRPVVAILDTGVGRHPWLGSSIVAHDVSVNGTPVGIQDPQTDPERTGVVDDPYEGVLDSDAGHGTFIAGLIRQTCPDANIIAVRVMSSDGAVSEIDLLEALKLLVIRQHTAQLSGGNVADVIDVVSLSLGYYHEQPDDLTFDPTLLQPLQALGEMGVAVVVSVGNDSTSRPMFPAAFTPYAGGQLTDYDHDSVPVISVGALNPNRTIALFSNAGDWVTCHRPGAALVSTLPVTFDAGGQPTYRVRVPGEGWRETLDPDSYHHGFGTWSGTSFAAPILAGELAQILLSGDCGSLDDVDPAATVTRAWTAIAKTVGVNRP